jgi:hypothetical protein
MKRFLLALAVWAGALGFAAAADAHPPVYHGAYYVHHGVRYHGGWYYPGRDHCHWSYKVWVPGARCYHYWDPGLHCYFHWDAGRCGYYPVGPVCP